MSARCFQAVLAFGREAAGEGRSGAECFERLPSAYELTQAQTTRTPSAIMAKDIACSEAEIVCRPLLRPCSYGPCSSGQGVSVCWKRSVETLTARK